MINGLVDGVIHFNDRLPMEMKRFIPVSASATDLPESNTSSVTVGGGHLARKPAQRREECAEEAQLYIGRFNSDRRRKLNYAVRNNARRRIQSTVLRREHYGFFSRLY